LRRPFLKKALLVHTFVHYLNLLAHQENDHLGTNIFKISINTN
jgi:hypothetical protein